MKNLILGVPLLAVCVFAQTSDQQTMGTQTTTTTTQTTTTEEHPAGTQKGVHSKNWKGMLVDANCGPGAMTAAPSVPQNETAERQAPEMGAAPAAPQPGSLARWESCPATSSTTQFGLVLSDGRMVRFDQAGNQRAQQEIRTNNKWMQAASSGKPAKVKVRGTLVGDTVEVESIK